MPADLALSKNLFYFIYFFIFYPPLECQIHSVPSYQLVSKWVVAMEKIPALFKPTENKKSLIKMSRERSSFTKVLLFLDSSSSSEKNSREIMWLPHHSLLMLILIGVKFENKKKWDTEKEQLMGVHPISIWHFSKYKKCIFFYLLSPMENLDMAKKKKNKPSKTWIFRSPSSPCHICWNFIPWSSTDQHVLLLMATLTWIFWVILEEIKPGSVQCLTWLKCRVLSH